MYIDDYVDTYDTPGNTDFTGYRVSSPAYYAFLDGYDTRALAFEDEEIEANTNVVTRRFAYYADLKERVDNLVNLSCGSNDEYYVKWSSSYIDEMPFGDANPPPVQAFDWTTNVIGKIYSNDESGCFTRWLPSFNAMAYLGTNVVYSTSIHFSRGVLWYNILPVISVGDPAVYDFLHRGSSSPSIPSFDELVEYAYGEAPTSSNSHVTARHVVERMGQADRVLSLFDRTVRANPSVIAYTNSYEGSAHVSYKKEATLPPLEIAISGSSATILTRPISINLGGIISQTNYVDYIDSPCECTAPRFRATKPSLSSFSGFSAPSGTVSVALDIGGQEIHDLLDPLFPDGEPNQKHVSFFAHDSLPGYLSLSASDDYRGNSILLPFPSVQSGTYETINGNVGVSSSYHVRGTKRPRIPFGIPRWPPDKTYDFMSSAREFTFASFISSEKNETWVDWDAEITYDDEDETVEFGYKSFIDDREPSEYRYSILLAALVDIEDKCEIGNVSNPAAWTGLTSSDVDIAVNNFNTNYEEHITATVIKKFVGEGEYWSGEATVTKNSYPEFTIVADDGTDMSGGLPVAMREIRISVTLPTEGIDIRDTAMCVDTRIKCATEANWDFPQLRTR